MPPTVVDLSQELATGMQVFPLHSPTHVVPWLRHEVFGFQSESLFCNTHAGTHLDAPIHFVPRADPVDQLPLERCFGAAVLLDLCPLPPRTHIGPEQLARCEQDRPLQAGDIVLLRTGMEAQLGQPAYLSDFSGLSEAGAQYLLQRGIKAVGIDGPGIDAVDARACPAHHLLLPRGVVVVENLVNLGVLEELTHGSRFTFYALPLKIRGASGSPVRAMALVD